MLPVIPVEPHFDLSHLVEANHVGLHCKILAHVPVQPFETFGCKEDDYQHLLPSYFCYLLHVDGDVLIEDVHFDVLELLLLYVYVSDLDKLLLMLLPDFVPTYVLLNFLRRKH